jgi:hypothetical protein
MPWDNMTQWYKFTKVTTCVAENRNCVGSLRKMERNARFNKDTYTLVKYCTKQTK